MQGIILTNLSCLCRIYILFWSKLVLVNPPFLGHLRFFLTGKLQYKIKYIYWLIERPNYKRWQDPREISSRDINKFEFFYV